MDTTMILMVVGASALAAFMIGALVGYASGKTDGIAEARDYYERRRN